MEKSVPVFTLIISEKQKTSPFQLLLTLPAGCQLHPHSILFINFLSDLLISVLNPYCLFYYHFTAINFLHFEPVLHLYWYSVTFVELLFLLASISVPIVSHRKFKMFLKLLFSLLICFHYPSIHIKSNVYVGTLSFGLKRQKRADIRNPHYPTTCCFSIQYFIWLNI